MFHLVLTNIAAVVALEMIVLRLMLLVVLLVVLILLNVSIIATICVCGYIVVTVVDVCVHVGGISAVASIGRTIDNRSECCFTANIRTLRRMASRIAVQRA